MKTQILSVLSGLALLAAVPTAALANTIDFESIPNGHDEMTINDQFLLDYGITFALDADNDGVADKDAFPTLEAAGSDGQDGFVNDPIRERDTAREGFEDQLGNFFLKTTHGVQNQEGMIPSLLIEYRTGPSMGMSGEIWDIDGNKSQGTEQWKIEALGADRQVIDSTTTIEGFSTRDDEYLNGAPYLWSFEHDNADIYAIRISFTGTKEWGTGLAFDNFTPFTQQDTPGTAPTPEPGTMALLGIGIVALVAVRRQMQ